MGLFDRSASKLSTRTTLLFPVDPGGALLELARRYDPEVRPWHGRLVFRNGVLLFGPLAVTPKLQQQAGLPEGTAVVWYTGAAVQRSSEERGQSAKQEDGDKLVRGLAERLGGTVKYSSPQTSLALVTSVYSEQAVPADEVVEALRPYGGNFRVEDAKADTYSLSGKGTYFYVAYWSPRLCLPRETPPAVGAMRSRRLHHWDLHAGTSARHAPRELVRRVGEGTLALASESDGVAVDVLGFRIDQPDDLLPA